MRRRRPLLPRPPASLGSSADGAVNCADFWQWPPNIFNPSCYGITAAKMFGTADERAAAMAASSPDVVYAPILPPPAVGAPTGAALTLPPADGQDAAQTIDRVLEAHAAAMAAQFRDTIDATAAGIDRAQQQTPAGKITGNTLIFIAAAFGVLLLVGNATGGGRT